ncbi:MAG: DUF4342 domain-containing protein [Bacillota bacterium]|nr:DUF4342 domain-containing protein [Bacillota bacterium]
MTTLEQVEKLKEKANISYEEAKAVLESVDGDILEALVKLENEGKVNPPANNGTHSSTEGGSEENKEKKQYYTPPENEGMNFSQIMGKIGKCIAKLFNKGNTNFLEVRKAGKTILQMPLTVVVILAICAFWVVIPLMIIGLFFDCRYVFIGKDIEKTHANNAMNKVAETAENIKNEVKTDNEEKKDQV